jgi:cell division protein FtsQ
MRLKAHEAGARSRVSRIRPNLSLAKKLWISVGVSLGLLVVLVVVAVFSPLLAIQKIEIVGNSKVSSKDLTKDLAFLKGLPLPQVSNDAIVAKLSKYQLIDSVSAVSMPPSTLRVVIVERKALAKVSINGIDYLYDAVGVQLGRAQTSDKLPSIYSAGDPKSSESFKQSIEVLLSVPVKLLPKIAGIQALSKDNVTLFLRSWNQKVLWGDDSNRALKAKVLMALLDHYDGKYGLTFDVSSPNNPTVR